MTTQPPPIAADPDPKSPPAGSSPAFNFNRFMAGGEVKHVATCTGIQVQRCGQIRAGRVVPTSRELDQIALLSGETRAFVAAVISERISARLKSEIGGSVQQLQRGRPRKYEPS